MAGKDPTGFLDLPPPQGGEDGAMLVIGVRFPVGSPVRKKEAGARGMQVVDRCEQPWHGTRFEDQPMEVPIGRLPASHVTSLVTGLAGLLCLFEHGGREMRRGVAQGQDLQHGSHLRHLRHLRKIEGGDANATTRLADREPLRLQPAECLPYRNVAGVELLGDVVLPQPRAGSDLPGNDAVGKNPAYPDGQRVLFPSRHML